MRDFLIQTSILDRFNGELCEAVLGWHTRREAEDRLSRSNPQIFLENLDRSNLFLVPLDDAHIWFRYHSLFADVLRKRLAFTYPDLLPGLHRRAASWYEQKGFTTEALHHCFNAGDLIHAAELLEMHGRAMLMRAEWVTLANALTPLGDLIHQRPLLGMLQAWALSLTGQWEKVDDLLVEIEELIVKDTFNGSRCKD